MRALLFDVDGTLTVSRQKIDPVFHDEFLKICENYHVYLVTGSDRPKTVEQLGEKIYFAAQRVYNCSGNDIWEQDKNIYTNDWSLPEKPWKYLESQLLQSKFAPKTGWHFEERPGMLNFSILGRKAQPHQRQYYIDWDKKTNERRLIRDEFVSALGNKFSVTAEIGGETGLDIYPLGCDKGQIIEDFENYDEVLFFGDKTTPGGNDHSIAVKVDSHAPDSQSYQVDNWEHTRKLLKQLGVYKKI